MAKIGLQNFLFGILTEAGDGTPSYGVATKPGKAVSANVQISNNNVSLYADDAVAETDTSFQSGTVTLTIDDEDINTMATLLGHTVSDGVVIRNANDIAPYVGLGRIITKMVSGVHKYKVEFLSKVKFGEPSQEDNTHGETVEFGTTEIEGTIAMLQNGDWSKAETFDTMAEAQAFLAGLFGAGTAATVTFDKNGATGDAPAAISTTVGAIINLPGVGNMTKAGKVFDGWDTSSTATQADLHTTYNVAGSVTLYAIWVNE